MNTYKCEITSLIIEGTTEKILQFMTPLKSICNKIVCFNEQKWILNATYKLKIYKNFKMALLFFVLFTFAELPSMGLFL